MKKVLTSSSRRELLRHKNVTSWTAATYSTRLKPAAATSDVPEMPPCDFRPAPYKGPTYEKIREIRRSNLSPAMLTHFKEPLLVNQGHMQWLFDHTGRRYLDLIGGIVTVSVGHAHPKVNEALIEQSKLLWHTTAIYLHPRVHEYAEKLVAKMPGNLKVAYFVNSGSEANDLAIFLARLYTGRYEVLSFQNAYHGDSPFLMGLTSLNTWRFSVPTGFGFHQTPIPDVYKGMWGGAKCRDSPSQASRPCNCVGESCTACDNYVTAMNDVIRYSTPKKGLAGFIAESIQGVGGTVQYPKNFLKKAFELVRSHGGICISDEVQTGFGRTGEHYWGFQGHDVIPDIVTMAKGIGNGFPMAAVITTPEIANTLSQALHFNTFGGDPLACAVGSTVLDVLEEEGCQERSRVVGTYLIEELMKLKDESSVIGDVRGKGLMIGVELVSNKETKNPLDITTVNEIWDDCKNMGVIVAKGGLHGNVLRIKPPMCITKEDVDFAVAVLRKVLAKVRND